MDEQVVILHSALTCTLTMVTLFMELASIIAVDMQCKLHHLWHLQKDSILATDLARKRYNRLKRRY